MSTYSAISDLQVSSDQFVTSILLYRLRDNPLAIAEGNRSYTAGILPKALSPFTVNGAVDELYFEFQRDVSVTYSDDLTLEILLPRGGQVKAGWVESLSTASYAAKYSTDDVSYTTLVDGTASAAITVAQDSPLYLKIDTLSAGDVSGRLYILVDNPTQSAERNSNGALS
jgi:hypothetical protein